MSYSSYCNRNSGTGNLFAIAGFLIRLLTPVIVAIMILLIAVAGGVWLYAKYKSSSS